jgi:hypothetical protein
VDLNNPVIIIVGALGLLLNLLFSGGTLFKLLDLAREWGIQSEKVMHHDHEILRLRDAHHDLRDTVQKVLLKQTQKD